MEYVSSSSLFDPHTYTHFYSVSCRRIFRCLLLLPSSLRSSLLLHSIWSDFSLTRLDSSFLPTAFSSAQSDCKKKETWRRIRDSYSRQQQQEKTGHRNSLVASFFLSSSRSSLFPFTLNLAFQTDMLRWVSERKGRRERKNSMLRFVRDLPATHDEAQYFGAWDFHLLLVLVMNRSSRRRGREKRGVEEGVIRRNYF